MPARPSTRAKILEAAVTIFAERGFEDATVREICDAARVNQASINYHFGDKHSLYVESVKYCCTRGKAQEPLPAASLKKPPIQQFRDFIHARVTAMMETHGHEHSRTLMMREVAHPTKATEDMVREYIRPNFNCLRGIVQKLVKGPVDPRAVDMILFSITGQFVFYKVCAPIGTMIMGKKPFARLTANQITDHIVKFSLAALGISTADWRSH